MKLQVITSTIAIIGSPNRWMSVNTCTFIFTGGQGSGRKTLTAQVAAQ
jgi:hypothetical protein